MANKPGHRRRSERQEERADGGKGSTAPAIEELRKRFLQFRREHRNRTRIPEVLRDAALATIQSGISADEVRRVCRISPGQLIRWIECRGAFGQNPAEEEVERAHVYPVEEGDVGISALQAEESEASALHLRVRGWEICIRQEKR